MADETGAAPEQISAGVKAAFAHLTDLDPHGVAIKLAATILIVDDRPDLHVMMLRRRARSEFVGGMMVFPGGGLDPEDADPIVYARVRGIDDAKASAAVAVERDGLRVLGRGRPRDLRRVRCATGEHRGRLCARGRPR